jgi:hypothetical protein
LYKVAGSWRRLHKEELRNFYASPNIIWVIKSRRMRGAGHVACMGQIRKAYNILVGKSEGKRPLRRPRSRWEYNSRKDLREIGLEVVNWIHLAQNRDQLRVLVNTITNLGVS